MFDNPFSKGDWVVIDGKFEGIVEELGLRTLKIRTFEKTLLTLPNSKVAGSSIENLSRRTIRRIKFTLKLSYKTPSEKVEKFISLLREYLNHHPNISKEKEILVYLSGLDDYAYHIMVYCFANTAEWEKWLSIREEIFIKIATLLKELNIELAKPVLDISFN